MQRKTFDITTTVVPLPQKDGRLLFAYVKPLNVRLLEWLLLALWLLAPAAALAALL